MKKKTIALLTATVMLLGVVVGGTIAWLTATADTVTNTFTVGDINITLDEADVNIEKDGNITYAEYVKDNGVVDDINNADRVIQNEYKLIPGSTYSKDPTVTVLANSEPCYVYVRVTETNNNSDDDIKDNDIIVWEFNDKNWIPVSGVENVYVYSLDGTSAAVVSTNTANQPLKAIITDNTITINSNLNKDTIATLDGVDSEGNAVESEVLARPKLVFDAYAVQVANMGTDENIDDAVEAWNKTFGTTK